MVSEGIPWPIRTIRRMRTRLYFSGNHVIQEHYEKDLPTTYYRQAKSMR